MAKKRGPDTFISRLFTRHRDLRKIEGSRAREMARTMKDVKKKALGLIERNMTTFREAGAYVDSAAAVSRAQQTVAEVDALIAQRADWATSNVLSMRQEAWTQGVSDIQFASKRLPGDIQASMAGSFGQVFPEAGFSAIEHPVLGVAPDAMFNGVRAGTTQNMRDVLVNAVVSGESVQETGRRLSDAMDLSVAAGERIARTNVNAAYNEAHRAVYDANSDIIAGYAWEATLDDRTSQVCFMLHGQFWPLGSKTPGPPAHWNCRSILIPVFKDPAIQSLLDETPRRARQYDKRGRMRDVMVKSSTTPEQWARRQPSEITRKITGSELKNSLFRRKLICFDDLVDPSLRVRTDEEIIRRAAGLHPGNKALQKQARAMGVKRIPSQQAIQKADASLARKQPWKAPEPTPLQKKAAEAPVPPKKAPPSLKPEVTPVEPPDEKVFVRIQRNEDLTYDRAMSLSDDVRKTYVKDFHGTLRFQEMEQALMAPQQPGLEVASAVLRTKQGRITGAISWTVDEGVMTIRHVGTMSTAGGRGAELMRYAVREAAEKNLSIVLESTPGARGFYTRLGFRQDVKVGKIFRASPSRVQKIFGAMGTPGRERILVPRPIPKVLVPKLKPKLAPPIKKPPPPPTPLEPIPPAKPKALTQAEWIESLSTEEEDAIKSWLTVDYGEMRKSLAGQPVPEGIAKEARIFESAIARAPKQKGTAYRGMFDIDLERFREISTSEQITMKAPSSTSLKRGMAKGYMLEAETSRNALLVFKDQTRGTLLEITQLQKLRGQAEVVVPRGSQYRVISREWKQMGKEVYERVNYLEIVLEEI